jgi:hypothetical protein
MNPKRVIDKIASAIWTVRYNKCGDFELKIPADEAMAGPIEHHDGIYFPQSGDYMLIETIEMTTDEEQGDYITLKGRTYDSLLDRRIIPTTLIVNYSFMNVVFSILNQNVFNPQNTARKMNELTWIWPENMPSDQGGNISAQYTGDNVLELIQKLCQERDVGYRMPYRRQFPRMERYQFQLYWGVERHFEQQKNPYVIFSPDYDNLRKTKYLTSAEKEKTIAYVAGEGEGKDRKGRWSDRNGTPAIFQAKTNSGWRRKEMFVDARDLQTKDADNKFIAAQDYFAMLEQRGREKLVDHTVTSVYDGELVPTSQWKYGVDFKMGDVVQIQNRLGIMSVGRVTEYIRSYSPGEGWNEYPTFETYYKPKG